MFISQYSLAKSITYFVSSLIASARFVGEVVITESDTTGFIRFKSIEFEDTLSQANCSICTWYDHTDFNRYDWTNNIPYIGDTVLIIMKRERAVVFGKKIKEHYRLWSIPYTMSIAIFSFENPILPLSEKDRILPFFNSDSITTCSDGCLLPISELHNLIKKYRKKFDKVLKKVDISDFENKEVYEIFYNVPLKYYTRWYWFEDSTGELKGLVFNYSNGDSLKVIPHSLEDKQIQIDEEREFWNWKLNIKEIEWIKSP